MIGMRRTYSSVKAHAPNRTGWMWTESRFLQHFQKDDTIHERKIKIRCNHAVERKIWLKENTRIRFVQFNVYWLSHRHFFIGMSKFNECQSPNFLFIFMIGTDGRFLNMCSSCSLRSMRIIRWCRQILHQRGRIVPLSPRRTLVTLVSHFKTIIIGIITCASNQIWLRFHPIFFSFSIDIRGNRRRSNISKKTAV